MIYKPKSVQTNQKRILFIVFGSITDPILHSQGVPLLNYLVSNKYECWLLSLEDCSDPIIGQNSEPKSMHFNWDPLKINSKKIFSLRIIKILYFMFYALLLSKKEKIEIIHARSLIASIVGLLIKTVTFGRVKLIYDNRGLYIEEEIFKQNLKSSSAFTKILQYFENLIYQRSDKIVVVSDKFKSYLINKSISKDVQSKISVIINRTNNSSKKFSRIINRDNTNYIGVYSGSATIWQNLDDMRKLIMIGTERFDHVKFQILTYQIKEFSSLFDLPNLSPDKLSIKEVDSSKVHLNLLQCDFGLLLRRKNIINEVAFPLKFAEYLSAGLPVIVSEGVGDLEELVSNNKLGVVLRNNKFNKALDEMLELLSDKSIHNHCRGFSEKYLDIKKSYNEYLDIYQQIYSK